MALYPCDFHNHRYSGPQRTAYPAIVDGTSAQRRKMRLCKPHFDDLVALCETFMFDSDHPDIPNCCSRCNDPAPHHAMYITLYDHSTERRDLYAPLCEAHAVGLQEMLKMTP